MTQRCRRCGCSNLSACAGGCWWVEDDLCSSCAVAVDVATGITIDVEELERIAPRPIVFTSIDDVVEHLRWGRQ
jgi:hypothetical protein